MSLTDRLPKDKYQDISEESRKCLAEALLSLEEAIATLNAIRDEILRGELTRSKARYQAEGLTYKNGLNFIPALENYADTEFLEKTPPLL